MLRKLSADYQEFKTLSFGPGLNIVVAETRPTSSDTDSRNGVGKSSLIELLHFLLGGRVDRKKSLLETRRLRDHEFRLTLDWPDSPDGLTVCRSGARPDLVRLAPDVAATAAGRFPVGAGAATNTEWSHLIEATLFGLPPEHPSLSGRTLLSYFIRRVSSHAFNDPIHTFPRQSDAEAATHVAYLLGLDWQLARRYQDIQEREAARRQLKRAASDPVWGKIVGKPADLRGQITVVEENIRELKRQIGNFCVIPRYEQLKTEADELSKRIRQLGNEDVADQRNLDQLNRAVAETVDLDVDYLGTIYTELGIVLGTQVRQRFDDVRSFHESVIRNRRRYLSAELEATQLRIERRRAERARLGAEQQEILQRINDGGALEGLTLLQQALAQEEAELGALRHRLKAADTLEASHREIEAERIRLQAEINADLAERPEQLGQATLLFNDYARRLYSSTRRAYLSIEEGRSSLKIEPKIDSDESQGIGKMVIFCFDLVIAVISHREGRGPDFLVHDSHLFDGVDDRQLAAALQLAAEVSEQERLQYIVTINSDDLDKAGNRGFTPAARVLVEPRLTDAYDTGGLFGFRF